MHQPQQMRRNLFTSAEGSFRVDVQSLTGINHLPARLLAVGGSARNLARDQCQAQALQHHEQIRLDCAHEASVVPLHQMPPANRINKIHLSISRYQVSTAQLYFQVNVCKTKIM
jgi:hypothetical protein